MGRVVAAMAVCALVVTACGGGANDGAGGGTTGSDGATEEALAELVVIDEGAERRPAGEDAFGAAASGDPLVVEDVLRTDATGFAQIDYFDGSVTRLDVDTEFEVVALGGTPDEPDVRTRLEVGRVWNRVDSVTGEAGRFEVETSVAQAAVRGTAFVVACGADGACTFSVLEGTVVVTVGEEEFELGPGEELTVQPDGSVDGPNDVGVDALLEDPWLQRNLDEDGDELAAGGGGGDGAPANFGQPNVTDPSGELTVPSLDVVASYSGWLPDRRGWVALEFADDWPPSDDLFSWFVQVVGVDTDGQEVLRAETQYHDGVRRPVTDPNEELILDGVLMLIFPEEATGARFYRWSSRVWPSESEEIEEDNFQGEFPIDWPIWNFDNLVDPRGESADEGSSS